MNTSFAWYASVLKPSWAPPSWLFGPVWSVLYVLIAISFGYVLYQYINKRISGMVVLPFALNLFFNLIFSPIQFGLQSLKLSAIDISLVLATLVWYMVVWYRQHPESRWVVYINIPYLLWVSFATVLQFTVTYLNW